MIRPPEWVPSAALDAASATAIKAWRQRNPRYRRPDCFATDREQLLVYAWTMRDWPLSRIPKVAESVLSRTSYNFPEPRELEAEYAERLQRAQQTAASVATHTHGAAWSGNELDACPTCAAVPYFFVLRGAGHDSWMYREPDCECHGTRPHDRASQWLRGVLARTADDPHALARLYRDTSDSRVTAWRASGKRLADLLFVPEQVTA